jgi:hypothetical protein
MRFLVFFILALGVARAADPPPNVLPSDLQHVLDSADSAVIYSLDPNGDPRKEPALHYVSILGRAKLNTAETHQASHAFNQAVRGWDNIMAECFNPRHALRIHANGHTYDYLLCYECHQIEVFVDDDLKVDMGAAGSPEILNSILRAHHLRLARTN